MKKLRIPLLSLLLVLCLLPVSCTPKIPTEETTTAAPEIKTPEAADWMTIDTSWIPGQNYDGIQIMEIRRQSESNLEIAHVPVTGLQSLDDALAGDARARMDAFESKASVLTGDKLFMMECSVTQSDAGIISIILQQQDSSNLAAGGSVQVSVYNYDKATGSVVNPLSRLNLTGEEQEALGKILQKDASSASNGRLTGQEDWLTTALQAEGTAWDVSVAQGNGAALLLKEPGGSMVALSVTDSQADAARQSLIVPENTPAVYPAGTKLVALTYDDGPTGNTEHLLDLLKQYDVKATFFLQGVNVKARPEVVAREYREGHEIGNHTYNHPKLTEISFSEVDSQVNQCNDLIENACGFRPTLLRPPYGATTYSLRDHMRDVLNMACVKWAGDLRDSFTKDINEIVNEALTTTKDGDILLLHDTHDYSVEATPKIIEGLRAQGFTFVTVSEIITRNGDPVVAGESYRYVRPAN